MSVVGRADEQTARTTETRPPTGVAEHRSLISVCVCVRKRCLTLPMWQLLRVCMAMQCAKGEIEREKQRERRGDLVFAEAEYF